MATFDRIKNVRAWRWGFERMVSIGNCRFSILESLEFISDLNVMNIEFDSSSFLFVPVVI